MTDTDLEPVQRRTVGVLVAGQVLGGIGAGASVSVGSVLAAQVAGSDALAGTAATFTTLGAAGAAIPLARLANRAGRRPALATGALVAASGSVLVIVAASLGAFPLLLAAFACVGVGTAVNLQARFAGTDVASPRHRGRDLSIIVWSTTLGAVAGPNLVGAGEGVAAALGLPDPTGSYAIAAAAQLVGSAVYLAGLRPDPLLTARGRMPTTAGTTDVGSLRSRSLLTFAIVAIALSHAVMVSVMAMSPVHLLEHGAALTVIGVTISLHIAGMYGLSPVFGILSDRLGRVRTILLGQALFAVALLVLGLGADSDGAVGVGLVLLGLGWSASTVSASALVSSLATGSVRTRLQGRTDLVMNLSGAAGGALAGPVLALVGYPGVAASAGVLVVLVLAAAVTFGRGAGLRPAV